MKTPRVRIAPSSRKAARGRSPGPMPGPPPGGKALARLHQFERERGLEESVFKRTTPPESPLHARGCF